jgi:hypothetical protein
VACACCGRAGEAAGTPPECWGCLDCNARAGTRGATCGAAKRDLVPYLDGSYVRWRLRTDTDDEHQRVALDEHATAIGAGFTTPGHWHNDDSGGWVHVTCGLCDTQLSFHTLQLERPEFERAAELLAEHRAACRGVQQGLFPLDVVDQAGGGR